MPSALDPEDYRADLDALPAPLRRLLDAELEAGNELIEVGHSHPAPPVGAYFKLARPVRSRPRASGEGLDFYERKSSLSQGEFTDAARRYWILEAPLESAGDYPDSDALRAARQPAPFIPSVATQSSEAATRFMESQELTFEHWKEGTGYDLEALRELSADEQTSVERHLTPPKDGRDVEALAALGTPSAQQTLRRALQSEHLGVRLAVLRHAPEQLDDETRTEILCKALAEAAPFAGGTDALDLILEFHPPKIVEALFIGLLTSKGEMAYHFAATLTAIHGIVESRYDWSLRPLYLAFNTEEATARRAAFLTLCETLGVDGPKHLAFIDSRYQSRAPLVSLEAP